MDRASEPPLFGQPLEPRPNTADYLLARGAPQAVAVVDGGRRYSYAELRHAAAALVAELEALDLPPGTRVAVLGPNSFFWVAAYLATMKAGLVAVPVSDKLTADDVRRNLAVIDCRSVLADRRSLRRFGATLDEGAQVITDEALTGVPPRAWPPATTCDPDADAVLMFTSGTTTRPRAVRVTHRNLQANTDSIIAYLGLRDDGRVLVILPFVYCYGASLLHTHLRVGGSAVLVNSFTFPETALDLLDREACTVFAGVPSTFQLLLRAASYTSRRLPSLRIVQQAGGKLPPVLVEGLLRARNTAQVYLMYGQTEATARLSYLPPDQVTTRPDSIGRGLPGVQLRVLDETGYPVAPGELGEIYAVGDNVSPGYVADPEASAAKFTPHGLRTGDLARVDEDGYIFIVDRRDDFIKSWGHRVSSQEIEAAALRLDGLVAAAAIGVPDLEAGESITLAAVARPGSSVTPQDVLRTCRIHLAKHMVPATVLMLDTLPLNANGKVEKASLRQLAACARNAG